MKKLFMTKASIGVLLSLFAGQASAQAVFEAQPVDDTVLETVTGREDVNLIAQSDQVSTVSRNSVGNNSVTGQVAIADNAFQNLSGLSLLNVNTGNNVAINASMNVNISIQPGL